MRNVDQTSSQQAMYRLQVTFLAPEIMLISGDNSKIRINRTTNKNQNIMPAIPNPLYTLRLIYRGGTLIIEQ